MQALWQFLRSLVIPNNTTTGARIEINVGNSGKINVFNSSGTLVDSIGGSNGAVLATDGSSRFIELVNGGALVGPVAAGVPDTVDAGFIQYNTVGANKFVAIGSPLDPAQSFNDQSLVLLQPGKAGLNVGSTTSGNPFVIILDNAGTSAVYAAISGAWIHTAANGTADTWQTPAYAAGFAGGGYAGTTYAAFQFRKDIEDNVYFVGTFNSTAAHTSTPFLFTLPAGYIPAGNYRFNVDTQVSGGNPDAGSVGLLVLSGSGNVSINAAAAVVANTNFYVSGMFPLGHLA